MAFLLNVSKEYAEQVWQNARKIINDKKCELLHKSIFRQIVAESKSEQHDFFHNSNKNLNFQIIQIIPNFQPFTFVANAHILIFLQ